MSEEHDKWVASYDEGYAARLAGASVPDGEDGPFTVGYFAAASERYEELSPDEQRNLLLQYHKLVGEADKARAEAMAVVRAARCAHSWPLPLDQYQHCMKCGATLNADKAAAESG